MCLVLCFLLGNASALTFDLSKWSSFGTKSYEFGFHKNDEGLTWAEWERKTKGVNFCVKLHNFSDSHYIDGYTLEISAQNVYEEPILLKCSDGDWYESLWYTGDKTYKPGRIAYSEYFFIEGDEKIKYISVSLVKYHVKNVGTVEVDSADRKTLTWTID